MLIKTEDSFTLYSANKHFRLTDRLSRVWTISSTNWSHMRWRPVQMFFNLHVYNSHFWLRISPFSAVCSSKFNFVLLHWNLNSIKNIKNTIYFMHAFERCHWFNFYGSILLYCCSFSLRLHDTNCTNCTRPSRVIIYCISHIIFYSAIVQDKSHSFFLWNSHPPSSLIFNVSCNIYHDSILILQVPRKLLILS